MPTRKIQTPKVVPEAWTLSQWLKPNLTRLPAFLAQEPPKPKRKMPKGVICIVNIVLPLNCEESSTACPSSPSTENDISPTSQIPASVASVCDKSKSTVFNHLANILGDMVTTNILEAIDESTVIPCNSRFKRVSGTKHNLPLTGVKFYYAFTNKFYLLIIHAEGKIRVREAFGGGLEIHKAMDNKYVDCYENDKETRKALIATYTKVYQIGMRAPWRPPPPPG